MIAFPSVICNASPESIDVNPSFLIKFIDIGLNTLIDACGFSCSVHSFFVKAATDLPVLLMILQTTFEVNIVHQPSAWFKLCIWSPGWMIQILPFFKTAARSVTD